MNSYYYSQSPMPSGEDFALYSYPEAYNTSSAPSYPSYLPATSYDSYSSHQAVDKTGLPPHSASYSPAMSASNSFEPPHFGSTSDCGASGQSTISSAMASPSLSGQNPADWQQPGVPLVHEDFHSDSYIPFDTENFPSEKTSGCVDPSLIEPYTNAPYTSAPYAGSISQSPRQMFLNPPSPAISQQSYHVAGPIRTEPRAGSWQPYVRSHSVISAQSHVSRRSSGSCDSEENKFICPIASCGRPIRDLKAHMLTHQSERPEKCPIASCPYSTKGFARRYDKNRHTLTHYKGTMVCDFCPGGGSSSEKSFNRTDVFKRHLQSVHNVEQTTPNSRRRPKAAAAAMGKKGRETPGTCRTCGGTFASAQELHDHIDDCVLRIVQQTEPSEGINEANLTSVADDEDVKASLNKHGLPTSLEGPTSFSGGDDEDFADCGDAKVKKERVTKGMTWSKGGGPPLSAAAGKGRRRRNYPLSWGAGPEKMKMKKRVMCVYDGQRRLCKDDLMMSADNEVRLAMRGQDQLPWHQRRWITDLDLLTLQRAEAFHGATAEERGPWIEEGHGVDLERLMAVA
ncbi:hypothetical protein CAC42_1627 [Sphaceloma murrayae]|uniref:C2H2-type domain-containing protein n=1 Tax=Sphaceloma murrayae TaxID=2082308 RepID=A0A2K1QHI0_9PEZI|nr:hypothetical protein CAC42_1627 [Sphaceloma murrayae]